jgi:hypothetical protein
MRLRALYFFTVFLPHVKLRADVDVIPKFLTVWGGSGAAELALGHAR